MNLLFKVTFWYLKLGQSFLTRIDKRSQQSDFSDLLYLELYYNYDTWPYYFSFNFSSFWVNDRLFFGTDRLHFVERSLGNTSAAPPRFYPVPKEPTKAKLTIYHDFCSPWSYIGSTRVFNIGNTCLLTHG